MSELPPAAALRVAGISGELEITAVRALATGVVGIELRGTGRQALPAWEPGAHVDLVLPSRRVRSYSLCSVPEDTSHYEIAVLALGEREGGSAELAALARPGVRLGFFSPKNHFPLKPAPAYYFVAGGIGITPLVSMIRRVGALGIPWHLLYRGRCREAMAFAADLVATAPENVTISPADEVARPDFGRIFAALVPGTAAYVCGPPSLLHAAESASWRLGPGALSSERFSALAPMARLSQQPFSVELARSGVRLEVPSDRSLLSVLRDVIPDFPAWCGGGSCGVCETRVLAGAIDHRDRVLSAEECARGDTMMVCVSRAAGPLLVLDC